MSRSQKRKTRTSAKSVDEAVSLALAELGAENDDVNIEVVDEGAKGFLGLGAKDAVVDVSIKDAPAFAAKQFLSRLLAAMDLTVDINIKCEDNLMTIDLSGDNMGIVIGKRGDTLDSLQYLASLIVNQETDEYIKVTIDTENYRAKRAEALTSLSQRLADKVARTGKKFTLEPMNPYERRIIHANLQDNEQVTTFSIGEDPYRRVVIAPKNRPQQRRRSFNRRPSQQAQKPKKQQSQKPLDPSIPTTYKAGYTINKRPETKDFKSFDEYLEAHKNDI